MSDDSGAKVEGPYVYDPYGNCFSGGSACSSSGEPYRFTGRRLDPETGLLYYRARYYWPQGGRFLSTDPVGYAADLNLYTYVGNDPTDKTDPTGEAAEQCTTDSSGTVHCTGDIETVVVTAQKPPAPAAKPPAPRIGGVIALPGASVGGAGLRALGWRAILGSLFDSTPITLPLSVLGCGDSPVSCATSNTNNADKAQDRKKKDAKRQLNTNRKFRNWFHKNFKGGPGGQGIPAGDRRNPDLDDDQILEAWEEYQQSGGR
jgi:RHS repeat-associated protein